jgi:Zn finger protein HypA/HybF involved in hydrogenase expression
MKQIIFECKNERCQTKIKTNGQIPEYCPNCGGTEFEYYDEDN